MKLVVGHPLFEVVKGHLKKNGSPEPIAGTLKRMHPDEPEQRVRHETIYLTLYAIPLGEMRREWMACLRWSRDEPFFSRHAGRARNAEGVLAKVPDGTAQSALDGFGKALSAIPPSCAKPSPTTQGAR